MPLTDVKVRNAKPAATGRRLYDTGGMYLEVAPSGGRWWRLKYRFNGKEKRLSLGTYPDTTLSQARTKRDDARALLAAGADPSSERKAEKVRQRQAAEHCFEAIAREWLQHQSCAWTSKTMAMAESALASDAFPVLGERPMSEVKAREVAAVVRRVEERGAGEAAARLLQRIRAVFRYAVVREYIDTNPTLDLRAGEVLKPRQVKHRAALPESELPTLLDRLDGYQGDPTTVNALRMLLLTAVRPGELRGARWAEFDLGAHRWRIPAARMKMKADHIVPLTQQAIDVLEAMRPLSGHRDLVFPSPYYPDRTLSENSLNSALARMGYKGLATAHGFRALFSTVAHESGHDSDVIERQLAHVERNQVKKAYNRSARLEDRARLMEWWGSYLDGKRAGGGGADQQARCVIPNASWREAMCER